MDTGDTGLDVLRRQIDDVRSAIRRESYPDLWDALREASLHLEAAAANDGAPPSRAVLARVVGEIASVRYFGATEPALVSLKASLAAALLHTASSRTRP